MPPTRPTFLTVLETMSAGRFEDLGQSMTDDLVFELPYGPDFIPNPIEGLEAWNQMQLMTFALFSSFRSSSSGSTTASTPTS